MYSSLHNHSEYSVLDGFGHPEQYLQRAREAGIRAFAVTEHGNAYSWTYFDALSDKYPEIKLIFGVEFYECFDHNVKDKDSKYFHLIALARNERGRIALNKLITRSNFEGFYYKPRVDLGMLRPYANDLIVLSACLASKIAREPDYERSVAYALEYKSIFPYFYLEMQSHATEAQSVYNRKILRIANQTGIPFVITTDSHAATEADLEFQGWHVRIARDAETESEIYSGCYVQSEHEIHSILDSVIGKANVDIGLSNTNQIADMIDEVHMPWSNPQLPTFPLPPGYANDNELLRDLCKQGWRARGFDAKPFEVQQKYRKRMDYELSVIAQMGFSGYFLIVHQYVSYAKDNGIVIGDGRGSGSSSIVNYLLRITEIDPLEYNLVFERFLNPERISMPDIDTDFAERAPIIDFLIRTYGEAHVCQILNVSYITPNVAIKDVGRVMKMPYAMCEKIAAKFTADTFDECLKMNREIADNPEYAELLRVAGQVSGRVRNMSMHAGGVCVSNKEITDYMPMKLGANGEHVIQADKKMAEKLGLVKNDILGVANLAIVQDALAFAGQSQDLLSADRGVFKSDAATYKLLCDAKTNLVFQCESGGMKDLLLRLQPTNIEDVSAVLALYRPDSMSMLDEFIENKHHPEQIHYLHPDMKPILESTYNCCIYQEQIMEIVRVFGGRTYGGADKFRKAISSKNREMVAEESKKLYQEILDNGYEEPIAKAISDMMAAKGGYAFAKAHSVAYAYLTLKTAYLKAHMPAEFFCAALNQNLNDFGAINKYILDAKSFGVEIQPPSVNHSQMGFSMRNGKVLFGLSAIKGIGENVAVAILKEREHGRFQNFSDFLARTSLTSAQVIALIKSGAIPTRDKQKLLVEYFEHTYSKPSPFKPVKQLPTKAKLLSDYGIDRTQIPDKEECLRRVNEIRKAEYERKIKEKHDAQLAEFTQNNLLDPELWEFQTLSVFLSKNPFESITSYLRVSFDDTSEGNCCTLVGIVSGVQKKKDRNKNTYAFVNLNTPNGLIEVTCWNSVYKQFSDLLSRGTRVAILVNKKDGKAIANQVKSFQQWLLDRKISLDSTGGKHQEGSISER